MQMKISELCELLEQLWWANGDMDISLNDDRDEIRLPKPLPEDPSPKTEKD